jgi:tetratricopeptide (TPR) repeat protein
MLGRYYGLIEAQPDDTWALGKLLACTSVKALVERYTKRISTQAANYNYRIILGNLLMQQKDYAKAAEAYKGATAQDDSRYVGHEKHGEALRKLGKSEDARAALDKALGRTSEARLRKRILRSLVDLTMSTRSMEKARAYFKALVALEPGNRLLRMEFAQMLTRNLLYKEALVEYESLMKLYRGNAMQTAELHKEVGKVYETMGRDPEAKKSYWTAMRYLTPNHWMVDELYQRIIAIYRRKNDLRSLIAELEKKWQGRGFFEWKILSGLYDETGDDEQAIKAYQAALRLQPQAIDVRARLISLLTRLNRQKEAIGVLETQMRLAPGEPRFYLDLAEMLWGEGHHDRALGVLAKLGRLFPTDPSVHIALADHYNKWGKPKLALGAYQTLVRIEPRDPGHLVSLGEQFWQRGEKAKALATWSRILGPGMYQSKEEAHAALAGIYAEHDMNKEAIEQFERAIKLGPKNVEHRRGVALALQKLRRFEESVKAWQTVIQMATDKTQQGFRREARTAIIDIWSGQNLLEQKLGAYRSRFDGRPPDLDSGYFLGEAYLKAKRAGDAEKIYQRILEIDREQVEALLALEQIYRESYRLRKAIAILTRLIEVLPRRAREFHDRIALLYLQLYQDKKAIEHATAALKLSQNDASGWARLGGIYEKKEDFAQAVEAYKKAIGLNNRLFKIYFSLARIYMMLGNHVGAVKLYHEVIRRSPDEDHVRQASRLAVDIDEYLGTLLDLERELIPLAFTYTQKKTYRASLVRLYARLVPRLAFEARFGSDEPVRKRARSLLLAIGERALKPLLEALSEKEGAQRDIAIDVLGHLGNKNAAPPLVRLALQPPPEDVVAPAAPPPSPYVRYPSYRRPVVPSSPQIAGHLGLKVRALVAAGRLRDPRTASDLAKLLAVKEVEVREAAAWALSLLADRSAQRPLETAMEDSKVGVQIFACVGLGALSRPPVGKLLAAAEDLKRRPEVRAACAFGLGLTRDRQAVPALLRLLADERSLLATKAAWALGLLGAPEATSHLARLVWVSEGAMQEALAWALVRSATGKPYGPGHDSHVSLVEGRVDWATHLEELRPLNPMVDAAALRQLMQSAAAQLSEGLSAALSRHRDLVLRLLSGLDGARPALALPMLGGRIAPSELAALGPALEPLRLVLVGALGEHCRSEDPDIRAHALRLAAKVDHPGLPGLVKGGLGDAEALVRRAAGEAAVIAARRKPASRDALVGLLLEGLAKQPWYEQRERLVRLGELGSPAALVALLPMASSSQGFLAEAAVKALGQIGDPRAAEAASAALRTPVARVRLAAVEALWRLDPARARRELPEVAAKDSDAEVRAAAARLLSPKRP